VERSRERLDRLGYFEEVNVETPSVPGTPDMVDVNFSVTEHPSGNLMLGLGYGQTSGLLFNASVSQDNFLGSGKRVNLAFNNSSVNTVYSFSYTNPYYTIDGVSRGFGAYFRQTDASQANVADYNVDTFGGNMAFGIPINEYDSVRLAMEFEHLKLSTTSFSPQIVTDFISQKGENFDTVKLTGSWSHDTRNRAIFPTKGMLQSLSAEMTVPGMDLEYYKLNYKQQLYAPLTDLFTFKAQGDLGYGDGYGNFDELPFFENYYAGGVRSVRGFNDNTLGPRDSVTNQPVGGAFKVAGSAEILFPPPFVPDSKSLRLSTFFDIGNVFKNVDNFDFNELRYSVGIGASWLSPLGALSFSLASPLNAKSGDDTQVFQFTFGTSL